MKKRVAVLLITVLLAVTIVPVMAARSPLYTDLPEDRWSYKYVSELSAQGVIKGYPDGSFHPTGNVTYGEALKLVLLAAGEKEPARQEGRHWAYSYMQLALNTRVVLSFNANNLDKNPTREEVAEMVARALDLTDISGVSPYNDCDDGFVVKLYEKGVMDGFLNDDGSRSFRPDKLISREEIATIVWRMKNTDVTKGMFRYNNYWLDMLEGVPMNDFPQGSFVKDANGRMRYTNGYFAQGIDVSRYNEEIDWKAVAADGIDFAIVRAGARGYGAEGRLINDARFDENMRGAIAAGLDVGAYYFSNAMTVDEALVEADVLIAKLEPYRDSVTYPVVCDWECNNKDYRVYDSECEVITKCIAAFCERVKAAGYTPMFYFNKVCGYTRMDLRDLVQYPFWLAEYNNTPTCIYGFEMLQYTSGGKVAGIGGSVDMNICLTPYGRGDHNSSKPPVEPEPVETSPAESEPVESGPIESAAPETRG